MPLLSRGRPYRPRFFVLLRGMHLLLDILILIMLGVAIHLFNQDGMYFDGAQAGSMIIFIFLPGLAALVNIIDITLAHKIFPWIMMIVDVLVNGAYLGIGILITVPGDIWSWIDNVSKPDYGPLTDREKKQWREVEGVVGTAAVAMFLAAVLSAFMLHYRWKGWRAERKAMQKGDSREEGAIALMDTRTGGKVVF